MYNSAGPHIMQVLITHKNKLLWLLLAAAKTQAYTCGVTYKELPLWQKYRQAYRRKRRQHKLLKDGTKLIHSSIAFARERSCPGCFPSGLTSC